MTLQDAADEARRIVNQVRRTANFVLRVYRTARLRAMDREHAQSVAESAQMAAKYTVEDVAEDRPAIAVERVLTWREQEARDDAEWRDPDE